MKELQYFLAKGLGSIVFLGLSGCIGDSATQPLPPTALPLPTFTPTVIPEQGTAFRRLEVTPTIRIKATQFPVEIPTLTPTIIEATQETVVIMPSVSVTPLVLPTFTPITEIIPTVSKPAVTPQPEWDFIISQIRLLSLQENGGTLVGDSVNCGYGHQIFVKVIDIQGNPLDGVVVGDTFGNPTHTSGDKGPGAAEFDVYSAGYELLVVSDANAGNAVSSQVSRAMSTLTGQIPLEDLYAAWYCLDETQCQQFLNSGGCDGHYSWEITFQRSW